MAVFIQIVLYLIVGFVEMFLATARTSFIAKGKNLHASAIVFVENILYFAILFQLVNNLQNNWPVFISYSTGGALGTFVNLRKTS
jgi:hypothetical protein